MLHAIRFTLYDTRYIVYVIGFMIHDIYYILYGTDYIIRYGFASSFLVN